MTTATSQAEITKLEAEAEAYRAEARYHDLQSERITRAREAEDARQDSQRVIDFTAEVSYGTAMRAIGSLSEMRNRDPEAPITINLLTPGGDVVAGLALFDYIVGIRAEGIGVTIKAIGMAASMGAILLQAGTTRLVTPNAFLMVHEISAETFGKLPDILNDVKFYERQQDRLLDILAERATIARATIKRKWKKGDWWISADEAVSAGLADGIA